MKTKVTIIMMEMSDRANRNQISHAKVLVDDNGDFINKYVSVKTMDDTLNDLLNEYTSVNYSYCSANISDCVHEKSSTECEVIYSCVVPEGFVTTKKGKFVPLDENFNLKEKYERTFEKTPRSIGQ